MADTSTWECVARGCRSSIASEPLLQISKLACYAIVEGATGKKINIARDDLGRRDQIRAS